MARIPPLNSLRAFDAAARHLSLTRAAKELSVTHGAISRQVLALEDRLGVTLFERTPRGLRLTPAGRSLAAGTSEAFARLSAALENVAARRGPRIITISTLPSLAARWLVPRIIRFQRLHPQVDLRVGTTARLVDLEREAIDLAIRYGRGPWPGLESVQLFEPHEFPVCAPKVARALKRPRDLAKVTLLHDMAPERWAAWLKAAAVDVALAKKGPVFEDMNVVLQAAIEGEGVALASPAMVEGDLASKRLVKPFPVEVPVDRTFHLVATRASFEDPAVRTVFDWLLGEAALQRR